MRGVTGPGGGCRNLSHVKLVVRGEQNQAGAEIASVRRKIGAYYGVEERDIEVDVERE